MASCKDCPPGHNCEPCREWARNYMRALRADPEYRERERARAREATAKKRAEREAAKGRACVTKIRVGMTFGKLTVLELLPAADAGHPRDGAWARCRCACGKRRTVRARHLGRHTNSCGCGQPPELRMVTVMRTLNLGAA